MTAFENARTVYIFIRMPLKFKSSTQAWYNADNLPFELFRMWEGFEALVVELT